MWHDLGKIPGFILGVGFLGQLRRTQRLMEHVYVQKGVAMRISCAGISKTQIYLVSEVPRQIPKAVQVLHLRRQHHNWGIWA